MPMEPKINQIDDERNPDRPTYERYVDVWFENGVKVRHVVDEHGEYYEQVFHPDDPDTVYDDIHVEDDFDADQLDEYVLVWLDVTSESLSRDDVASWDQKMIRLDKRASPTNVRYE